ncbi:LCP family protein [Candidatus Uhrbacteria bacterium]|nr:LCP family protein [Candidatus Uhrbacteria bacterium]
MVEKPHVNLLKRHHTPRATKRSPALFFGRRLFITLAALASIGIIFSYQVSTTSESSGNFPTISLFSTIRHLVSSGDKALDGEEEDRVNFLLLGIGGEGHDGPQLTDTIIFTSFKPSDGSVAMMSLPRDMTVPIPNYGYRKVNHANAYGEMDNPGSGPELASQVIGDVLDEEINYYLRVDFAGFAEFIDAIGGVDVYIENAFTDSNYPIEGKEYDECGYEETNTSSETSSDSVANSPAVANTSSELAEILAIDQEEEQGILEEALEEENKPEVIPDYSCRFESITFYEGWTHMDGQTALKFARSRHGNNGEGSDFARSERQQKIILAVKDKVLSASTFLNPSRISKMMDTLKDNIATNLDVWEIVRLAGEFKDLSAGEIVHHVIDASDASPLYATVLNGAYVLLPKNDDWSALQRIAENIFTPDSELNTQFADAPEQKPLFVKVEIQNGTNITGLAFRASQLLDGQGFDVVKVGNAVSRGYEHTVIYDLTNGQRSEELKALRDYLQADVTLSATGWMLSGDVVPQEITFSSSDYEHLTTQDDIDFLIILGETAGSFAIGASPEVTEEIP